MDDKFNKPPPLPATPFTWCASLAERATNLAERQPKEQIRRKRKQSRPPCAAVAEEITARRSHLEGCVEIAHEGVRTRDEHLLLDERPPYPLFLSLQVCLALDLRQSK